MLHRETVNFIAVVCDNWHQYCPTWFFDCSSLQNAGVRATNVPTSLLIVHRNLSEWSALLSAPNSGACSCIVGAPVLPCRSKRFSKHLPSLSMPSHCLYKNCKGVQCCHMRLRHRTLYYFIFPSRASCRHSGSLSAKKVSAYSLGIGYAL